MVHTPTRPRRIQPAEVSAPEPAQPESPANEITSPVVIGELTITKVVREAHPIRDDQGEMTIGEFVDTKLRELAKNGEEVQTIAIDITPEQWNFMRSTWED
jgi:hypothetical protein